MPALKTMTAGSALFYGTAAVLMLAAPAFAQQAINTPILASDPNFRDLAGPAGGAYGGTGYADSAGNGSVMRTGVFYRSMALSNLTYADWRTLSSLHIVLDIDLRAPGEIDNTAPPDPMNGHDRAAASALGHTIIPKLRDQCGRSGGFWRGAAEFGPRVWPRSVSLFGRQGSHGLGLHAFADDRGGAFGHHHAGLHGQQYLYRLSHPYCGPTVCSATMAASGAQSNHGVLWVDERLFDESLGLTQAEINVLRAKMGYRNRLSFNQGR